MEHEYPHLFAHLQDSFHHCIDHHDGVHIQPDSNLQGLCCDESEARGNIRKKS